MSVFSCPECGATVAKRDHDPVVVSCPICATEMNETDG